MPVAEIQKELNLDIQLESALNICGINMPPEKVQILVAAFNRVSTPTKNRVQILQILFQVNLFNNIWIEDNIAVSEPVYRADRVMHEHSAFVRQAYIEKQLPITLYMRNVSALAAARKKAELEAPKLRDKRYPAPPKFIIFCNSNKLTLSKLTSEKYTCFPGGRSEFYKTTKQYPIQNIKSIHMHPCGKSLYELRINTM